MNKYYENVIKTIEDSINSIDEKTYITFLDECESTLLHGGKIIASGLGKNVPICEKFVGTLNSLGIQASFLHTNSAVHGDLGIVRKEDLVFLLSKSGDTSETVTLAHYLKKRGANTWLLTFGLGTKAEKIVHKVLRMKLDNEGDEWNIVPNNSTTIYLILLQGVALELARRLNVTLDVFKSNHPGGAIGESLK